MMQPPLPGVQAGGLKLCGRTYEKCTTFARTKPIDYDQTNCFDVSVDFSLRGADSAAC